MTARATRQQDRSVTNPAFSSRKLKLGTFQTNLDSGCVMSDLDGRLDITWPNTLGLARLAEEMDFEALVPVARWHGFGGATNPQGRGFEAYTWAAGIAASTAKAGVFATSHISLNHPIVAAKQSTVIDHISGGRYALNIVTGWNQPEIDMFGSPMMGHTERYACAEGWRGRNTAARSGSGLSPISCRARRRKRRAISIATTCTRRVTGKPPRI